ncbi:hypothetical protein ABFS82_03G088100 [Erythranthe guttata]|uniref:uncharacterized protein LOC105950810 isoform X1 n=1 Tax=Erythranthe guttata TaxID=4155 RepID=UPI00064D8F30|nr:PREDICTED: uncharacterized protein LOC105950810 isoform X1 [Erythranthe guttata]|eukprot:XP_012829631.1 PREDICTED: uncharacterized protein LOC105950810 isoform X1 [Erythranthe guttata]
MGTICLLCGDRGFAKAFVDCVNCLDASVHLYCLGLDLDAIEETWDEDIHWVCEECDETESYIVSTDIEPFSEIRENEDDSSTVQTEEERVYEDDVEQSYEGITRTQLLWKENAKCNWRKKRSVKKSTVEKYEHRRCSGPSNQSYEEHVKTDVNECTRSKDDATLSSEMKENEALGLENHCSENDHIENEEEEPIDVENDFRENNLLISSVAPVVMPVWRGSFSIWNENHDIIDGILAHMSNKACEKVNEEASQFQTVLYLEMLPKTDVWPKSFEESEPTGDSIALYFFPSEISERIFDGLVEEMMHKELALKAPVHNGELLIFTSKELPIMYWRVQSKYYLWGVFRSNKQSSKSHSRSYTEELDENSPTTTTPTKLPSATDGAKTERRKGKQLDDAWRHANLLDGSRQKAECRFCGFISWYGGISRLKAHLGGGEPRFRLPGCDKVSPQVKKVMSDWFTEWVKSTKAAWTTETKVISAERKGRQPDSAWEHVKPLNEARTKAQCNYCGFVSCYGGISRLKAHLAGGSPQMQVTGCLQVPLKVQTVMEQWFNSWTKGNANPCKRGRTTPDQMTNTSMKHVKTSKMNTREDSQST